MVDNENCCNEDNKKLKQTLEGEFSHKRLNLCLFLNDAFQNLFCRFIQQIWCVWAALIGDNGDAQFVLRINE